MLGFKCKRQLATLRRRLSCKFDQSKNRTHYPGATIIVNVSYNFVNVSKVQLILIEYTNSTPPYRTHNLTELIDPKSVGRPTASLKAVVPETIPVPKRYCELKLIWVNSTKQQTERLAFEVTVDASVDSWPPQNPPVPTITGSSGGTSSGGGNSTVLWALVAAGVVVLIILAVIVVYLALRWRKRLLSWSATPSSEPTISAEMQAALDARDAAAKARAKHKAAARAALAMGELTVDTRAAATVMNPDPEGRRSVANSVGAESASAAGVVGAVSDSPRSERRPKVSFSPAVVGQHDDDRPNSRQSTLSRGVSVAEQAQSFLYDYASISVPGVGQNPPLPKQPTPSSSPALGRMRPLPSQFPVRTMSTSSAASSNTNSSLAAARRSAAGTPLAPAVVVDDVFRELASDGRDDMYYGDGGGSGDEAVVLVVGPSTGAPGTVSVEVVPVPVPSVANSSAGGIVQARALPPPNSGVGLGIGGSGGVAGAPPPEPPKGLFVEDEELVEDEVDDGAWRKGSDDDQ